MPLGNVFDVEKAKATEKGYDLFILGISPDWPKEQWKSALLKELEARKYVAISIGNGIRGNKDWTPVFEKLVNLCIEKQPGAKLGFAVLPNDVVAACERALGRTDEFPS